MKVKEIQNKFKTEPNYNWLLFGNGIILISKGKEILEDREYDTYLASYAGPPGITFLRTLSIETNQNILQMNQWLVKMCMDIEMYYCPEKRDEEYQVPEGWPDIPVDVKPTRNK